MFEPLLFHLFFLYSSLSLIDRSVKYARFLAVGKIFLVCFYLFVETVCHLYVFIQTSQTESSHTAPSLLPLHIMVSPGGVCVGDGGGVHHRALVSGVFRFC